AEVLECFFGAAGREYRRIRFPVSALPDLIALDHHRGARGKGENSCVKRFLMPIVMGAGNTQSGEFPSIQLSWDFRTTDERLDLSRKNKALPAVPVQKCAKAHLV